MADGKKWSDFNAEIIASLNIEDEYRKLGLTIPDGAKPSPKGWLRAHAIGREDKRPSAAVHLETGVYVDRGGRGDAMTLFDFAVRIGRFPDWKDARRNYAIQCGLGKRLPKKEQDRPEDKFNFTSAWNPLAVRGLVSAYKGITEESLRLCGARLGKYPAKSSQPRYVVVLPVYGPQLTDAPPRGYVLQAADGQPLMIYQGEGVAPEPRKRMNVGPSGLVGRHGIERIADEEMSKAVELVWKVEGISDLLALQAFIPEELRDKHVVVTNASGATETTVPSEVSIGFTGKKTAILHDADEPGQDGAKLWSTVLANISPDVRNVRLPYPVEPKHGKDLRDWINEGHSYDELLGMLDEAEPFSESADTRETNGHLPKEKQSLKPHELILKRLGAVVLGHYDGGDTIAAYSEKRGHIFEIKAIDNYRIEKVLLHLGHEVEDIINTSNEEDATKISMPQLRRAFAIAASERRITDRNQFGSGIWEMSGRLVLVGSGEIAIWNGGLTRSREPTYDGRLMDFGCPDPWFDFDQLESLLKESENPQWCRSVLNEATSLFARWDNWVHDDTPELTAALVCCSWIQTVWTWRPQIAITGPTNSGKSVLMENALKHLFGGLAFFATKPTEAGIRQHISHSAKIILIDEFEHDQHRQKILELFRTSSRGGEVVRGTGNQKGMKFGLRHIPWVGAIETGMKRAADRNRYIILELSKLPRGRGAKLKIPPAPELADLGLRLMVVAMRHWKSATKLSADLKARSFDGVDNRVIESYSVPCAMLGSVLGLDADQSVALMGRMLKSRDFSNQAESDEELLLRDIYESVVFLAKGDKATVSELISGSIVDHSEAPRTVLQRVGIKRMKKRVNFGTAKAPNEREVECVFFVKTSICRELLKNSDFGSMDIEQILFRLPFAFRDKQRMGSHSPRGVCIPLESINQVLGLEDDEQISPEIEHGETGENGSDIF